ncbi:MAG: hypothetical protein JEZ02_18305 [Desulfatibacillum sp.]|nr:hypothetical protein [Desulfatibacillum sp.]
MEKILSFSGEPIPWYDSTPVCGLCFVIMGLIAGFGLMGVHVGWEAREFRGDLWVPGLLVVFSGVVMLSLLVRLVRRQSRGKGSFL